MRTIILSPHLDDAAYSCGGWIWEQVHQGNEIIVCTIFAASPSGRKIPLFAKFLQWTWHLKGDHVAARRKEDMAACLFMGCTWLHLEFLDCIYRYLPESREPLIHRLSDLSSPIHEKEYTLIDRITEKVRELFPEDRHFLAPMGVGGHVDHRITRIAAERLGGDLHLYMDFPYGPKVMEKYNELLPAQVTEVKYPLSLEGLEAWQQSIALYPSQLHSFWKSNAEMEKQVREFSSSPLGCRLWKV